MPIVDIDFNVAGFSAARWDEDTAAVATDLRSDGGKGAAFKIDVEES